MKPLILLIITWYGLLSLAAYVAYALDKKASIRQQRRTPERTLHMLAVCGGWPGALLAQQTLRHKSSKTSFLVIFWVSVVANLAATWALITFALS